MNPGPEPAHTLEGLLAAGTRPDAVEAGRRWAAARGSPRSGVLLVVGGDPSHRSDFLRALAQEARAAGRAVRTVPVAEIAQQEDPPDPAGGWLISDGDALEGHPAAADHLVSCWQNLLDRGLVLGLASGQTLERLPGPLRQRLAGAEVASLDGERDEEAGRDEFGDFLADVSTVVAGLLDGAQPAEDRDTEEGWIGPPPPDRSLADYVGLRGADSTGARIAREVLASPASGYSPLTVWAGPGTGKTTLLAGIARAFRERYPGRSAAFLAPGRETLPAGEVLAGADLLVIDDLERLEGVDLAPLLGRVLAADGQVVVACSGPPAGMGLAPQLTTLLHDGVVLDIGDADEPRGQGKSAALAELLASCDCADWLALDDRIIEEPG